MAVNKEQAVIDFLCTCPEIYNNPLFFNFVNAKSDNKQIITSGNDKNIQKPYIDGSVLKRYSFTLIDFRSVSYQAIVKVPQPEPGTTTTTELEDLTTEPTPTFINENVEEYVDIQTIIDWINEQEDAHNYPQFGNDCHVEEMRVTTENPVLNGVDTQSKPALAKYSFTIQIDYIDYSKAI